MRKMCSFRARLLSFDRLLPSGESMEKITLVLLYHHSFLKFLVDCSSGGYIGASMDTHFSALTHQVMVLWDKAALLEH